MSQELARGGPGDDCAGAYLKLALPGDRESPPRLGQDVYLHAIASRAQCLHRALENERVDLAVVVVVHRANARNSAADAQPLRVHAPCVHELAPGLAERGLMADCELGRVRAELVGEFPRHPVNAVVGLRVAVGAVVVQRDRDGRAVGRIEQSCDLAGQRRLVAVQHPDLNVQKIGLHNVAVRSYHEYDERTRPTAPDDRNGRLAGSGRVAEHADPEFAHAAEGYEEPMHLAVAGECGHERVQRPWCREQGVIPAAGRDVGRRERRSVRQNELHVQHRQGSHHKLDRFPAVAVDRQRHFGF